MLAGTVALDVFPPPVVVAPLLVVVVPSPDEPPPAGAVVPALLKLDPLFVDGLELDPPLVTLDEPAVVDELPDTVLLVDACVATVAELVVGTVRVGAPAVSVVPLPLPPHAVSASAAMTAAAPAMTARE